MHPGEILKMVARMQPAESGSVYAQSPRIPLHYIQATRSINVARMELAESGGIYANQPGFHCITSGLQWQKKSPNRWND